MATILKTPILTGKSKEIQGIFSISIIQSITTVVLPGSAKNRQGSPVGNRTFSMDINHQAKSIIFLNTIWGSALDYRLLTN